MYTFSQTLRHANRKDHFCMFTFSHIKSLLTLQHRFADCEGLDGGNKLPIAARAVMRMGKFGTNLKGKRIQELRMKWATGEQKSRGWMVRKFYPRILFTFSDCVCYVTKNFR
jgi:hypothetical protein